MDFLAICQGLGLALAAGLIIGVVLPAMMPSWGVIVGAAPIGVLACAAALNEADEALWPAVPIGILAAGLAAMVSRDVAAGAARRAAPGTPEATIQAQAPGGVTAIVVLAAIALAVLSIFVPPVSLVAASALAWLWVNRRKRDERKHEGLRVLR
ncbi:MAG: hypothetical protein ACXWXU_07575 [Solirubrobacterales bacterium]